MTKEEFINWFEERYTLNENDIYGFGQLYDEVTKPHWISVEDELPPKKSEYDDLSNNVLATDGKEIYESVYNYDFEDWFTLDFWGLDNITHWMPLPSVEHLRETTKMIEKGGEE